MRLYQAVTLGAKRFSIDDSGALVKGVPRHPIVEDDVVIYAGRDDLGPHHDRYEARSSAATSGSRAACRPAATSLQAQATSGLFESRRGNLNLNIVALTANPIL